MVWAGVFLSVAWPTGVQLLVFFCSSVPVVLFGTPGISGCRSQHVPVESSSLLHHSIYLWFICFHLGKTFTSCSFGLPRVPFVNCRQFMYLVISLLVFCRAGCGIWLYQCLIIVYFFTFDCYNSVKLFWYITMNFIWQQFAIFRLLTEKISCI